MAAPLDPKLVGKEVDQVRREENENEAENQNMEDNLEEIIEELFDIEGVGVLTRSEVDKRVNMILKMYDEADDEAEAGYELAGVEDELAQMILE